MFLVYLVWGCSLMRRDKMLSHLQISNEMHVLFGPFQLPNIPLVDKAIFHLFIKLTILYRSFNSLTKAISHSCFTTLPSSLSMEIIAKDSFEVVEDSYESVQKNQVIEDSCEGDESIIQMIQIEILKMEKYNL